MQIIIFSYDREEMLISLLSELSIKDKQAIIIDDGSPYSPTFAGVGHTLINTPHEGKRGFWKKWVMAQQLALGSKDDWFLFLPDDIKNINLDWLEGIKKQGWEQHLFAINVINCGRTECWGQFSTGQDTFEIDSTELNEVGFVDCGFFTNRYTLEAIEIHEVHHTWFKHENISSGVGCQMSESLRNLKAKMMMPTPSLCKHGKHESKMHPVTRKSLPLSAE